MHASSLAPLRLAFLLAFAAPLAAWASADEAGFVPLFNGRDLSGWTPKFAKHPLDSGGVPFPPDLLRDAFLARSGTRIAS